MIGTKRAFRLPKITRSGYKNEGFERRETPRTAQEGKNEAENTARSCYPIRKIERKRRRVRNYRKGRQTKIGTNRSSSLIRPSSQVRAKIKSMFDVVACVKILFHRLQYVSHGVQVPFDILTLFGILRPLPGNILN